MITLIGTYNSIIGFGLCGIKKVHEVTKSASEETLVPLIENADSGIILIDEALHAKISQRKFDKIFVVIPDRFNESAGLDDIDELVKDTIGISLKVK